MAVNIFPGGNFAWRSPRLDCNHVGQCSRPIRSGGSLVWRMCLLRSADLPHFDLVIGTRKPQRVNPCITMYCSLHGIHVFPIPRPDSPCQRIFGRSFLRGIFWANGPSLPCPRPRRVVRSPDRGLGQIRFCSPQTFLTPAFRLRCCMGIVGGHFSLVAFFLEYM